ncbi:MULTISPECIES: hypothetical protein [unclassified Paenibacillus]|uniref:hypothetical protein n=1 Tax=unclassified Paenibacillus TaxID=185978 RepID=UPI00092FDAB8|nr:MULTISPECIES: hypothetical protein [unclassified Paenibacillus]
MTLNLYTYVHNNPLIHTDPTGHVLAGTYVGANIENARNYGQGSELYWQVRSNLGTQAKSFIPGAQDNDNNDFKFWFGVATMTSAYPELNNEKDASWARDLLVSLFDAQYDAEQGFYDGMFNFVTGGLVGSIKVSGTKSVNGNSTVSTKPQHGYEIFVKDGGDVVKNGISGRPLNKNGTSPRANQQVNAWNKAAGYDKYDARIIGQFPDRYEALNWETNYAQRLWENGNSMSMHSHPRPWEQ